MEDLKAEIKGYIVPYDIPSENVNMFKELKGDSKELRAKKRELKRYVRAKRVMATYYLHSLGVLATNSVVLVPTSRKDRIDKVVSRVQGIYKEIKGKLKKEGFNFLGAPIIKKVPIVQTQLISFKDLAEKQLKERLDKQIDSVATLIEKIKEGVEEARAKSLKYQLKKVARNLEDLEKVAKELGLSTDNQFVLLGELIGQAIGLLEGA